MLFGPFAYLISFNHPPILCYFCSDCRSLLDTKTEGSQSDRRQGTSRVKKESERRKKGDRLE